MKYVRQMRLHPDSRASDIINVMRSSGVLGGGRVARAADLLKTMFEDPSYTVFLTLAGPVVPGGLKLIISDLLRSKHVDAIVSNGANITHDIIEALGCKHIQGDICADDTKLLSRAIGRIGDIYVNQKAFKMLEKTSYRIIEARKKKKKSPLSVCDLLDEFGRALKDKESILVNATKVGAPIFSPGILDSMLGLHIWTYGQLNNFKLDVLKDMNKMADIIFDSKKIGVIILGGGMPKHFTLGATMLKGGVDAAIQITMDRPETGSLSGASLEEAISWKKAKVKGKLVTVIADFTIVFPLLVSYALS
ncbi:MAG: deoxyhypusine synthase [Candidatus Bathyarchaeota archaeon]